MRAVTDSVTHDLKSPLTRLKANLELTLQRTNQDAAAYRDAVAQAITEADRVLATFDALIAIARTEAKTSQIAKQTIDVAPVLHDMVEFYRPLAEQKKISIAETIGDNCFIDGHRQFLSQALGNLLDNAVKFSPEGGQIEVELRGDAKMARLRISDSGPGIAAPDRERVLKRFVRLDDSRGTAGSGLGLSLVAGVAKLHGAQLDLSDSELGGLTVHLTFALAKITNN